jgi:hypothetical protein
MELLANRMRADLKTVKSELERLELFATQADAFNMNDWPNLKSECGSALYNFSSLHQRIYSDGRDCAIWMSHALGAFYDVGEYPTLKSFVDSFEGKWVYQIDELEEFIAHFRRHPEEWKSSWAMGEMLKLYEKQIAMLKAVKVILVQLKDSNLYRQEAGLPQRINMGKQHINITGATNVQIGDNNEQQIVQSFTELIKQINESSLPAEQKATALEKLKDFLNLPLVSSILGSAVGGMIGA